MRSTPRVTAQQAMRLVPPGGTIVATPGCGTPETLLRALGERAPGLGVPRLLSGLLLGAYPFLAAVQAGLLTYTT